jgi:thioredoxin reductase (NADPH)
MPELTARQRQVLERLVAEGFQFIVIPPYENALCVRQGNCAALLAPETGGGIRILAPPSFLIDGNLSAKVSRREGEWFVWKQKELEATAERKAELERFGSRLTGMLGEKGLAGRGEFAPGVLKGQTDFSMRVYDVICIGAGPTGLACAIEAVRAGMRPLVIDKGCLCNSLSHYPVNMMFFTTPELLEIGDLPLTCAGEKPSRTEALKYYRKAAEHYGLELRLYERVLRVEGSDGRFAAVSLNAHGEEQRYLGRKVVIATGYYDLPNLLGVPGEELAHVAHYYTEPHAFWNQDVVVVGAQNSAAEAALDLFRAGARVTLVHRGRELGKSIKYWVRPDIENRIKAGEIKARFRTRVVEIRRQSVLVEGGTGPEDLPARQVFLLTGYHPDFEFLESLGVTLDSKLRKPRVNPETLESNVPGVYLAGVVIGGLQTNEIFIENGRHHGKQIIGGIKSRGA